MSSNQPGTGQFGTHHFALDEFEAAHDTFARSAPTSTLEVVLTRTV